MTNDETFRTAWLQEVWWKSLQEVMQLYAMKAWRELGNEPIGVNLLCVAEEGVIIMSKNQMGDWRTNLAQPHKPPLFWMPCPPPPKKEG